MLRIRSRAFVLLICGSLLTAVCLAAPKSAKTLSPTYRHWLEVEVPYIISTDEKKEFLSLTSDEQRDNFINAFWRIRNPDPDSGTNPYKDEHYRRLAYANDHFGDPRYENGWHTTQGRIYIILGAPKQKAVYHEKPNVRPIEIWFYESQTPALPPYFNVLFYKPSPSEDWRLYSPRFDGPDALVTTGRSQNNPKFALKFIKQSLGSEAGKIACTLIPAEPCDSDDFQPTMDSDMMLETINSLPDNPLTKQSLEANRMRERVTTSLFTGDQSATLNYVVFRDEDGRQTLSYLLSFAHPDAGIIGSHPDGSLYYDLVLHTSVLTPDGKPAFDQEEELTGNVNSAEAEVARKKIFSAEGRVPLTPGQFSIVATLTNKINHVAIRKQASVTVPAVNPQRIGISELVEYGSPAAVPDPSNHLPFSASKVRFTPRAVQIVNLRAGQKLPIAFQLWLPAQTGPAAPQKVHLRYVYGTVAASHEQPAVENEDIDAGNHDKAGNLVTGHTLDTSTLLPGSYRLVVTATAEGSPQPAFAAMTIHVQHAEDFADRWTAYGTDSGGVEVDDLKRGLSAEAQGSDDLAKTFYAKALAEGPSDARPLDKLASLLDRHGENEELAKLSDEPILNRTAIEPKTLLILSQALTKAGNPKGVVRLLEPQIKLQPPTAPMYLALAAAYEATGDRARAGDLRTLAAKLK